MRRDSFVVRLKFEVARNEMKLYCKDVVYWMVNSFSGGLSWGESSFWLILVTY